MFNDSIMFMLKEPTPLAARLILHDLALSVAVATPADWGVPKSVGSTLMESWSSA